MFLARYELNSFILRGILELDKPVPRESGHRHSISSWEPASAEAPSKLRLGSVYFQNSVSVSPHLLGRGRLLASPA
jgi:hypothetical protein